MSLVTSCPDCATTFKVVRDQLRISDGWVRCGRCSHVFDASLDLRELSDAALPLPVTAVMPAEPELQSEPRIASTEPEAPVSAPVPALPVPTDDFDEFDDAPMPAAAAGIDGFASAVAALPALPSLSLDAERPLGLIADEPWQEPMDSGFDDFSSAASLTPARSIAEMAPSLDLDLVSQVRLQKDLRHVRVAAARKARAKDETPPSGDTANLAPLVQMASEPEPPPVAAIVVPSFLREASSPIFWRAGKGRAILGAAVAVMGLLLVAQVVHRERDTLAASRPALQPLLARVCAVAGCELAPLRRISDITIDGAAFAREKFGDGYQFSLTLHNAARVPLAMPAVELSLLDSQEQVVVRRVLLPADFGAPAVLSARADRAASLPLALSGAEVAELPAIAGYHVGVFYP